MIPKFPQTLYKKKDFKKIFPEFSKNILTTLLNFLENFFKFAPIFYNCTKILLSVVLQIPWTFQKFTKIFHKILQNLF